MLEACVQCSEISQERVAYSSMYNKAGWEWDSSSSTLSAKRSRAQPGHPEDFSSSLEGLELPFREALLDLMPVLWPAAAVQRIVRLVSAPLGSIVVGSVGSRKSELVHRIASYLHDSPRSLVHVETVKCSDLRGKTMAELLRTLTITIDAALANSPSLLLLEDLDSICPASQEDANSGSYLADAQAELIASHLARLLDRLSDSTSTAHRKACALFQDMMTHEPDASAAFTVPYVEDRIATAALDGAVYVLASSETASLQPTLLAHGRLRRVLSLPPLNASSRVRLLRSYLEHVGSGAAIRLEDWASTEESRIARLTEGFCASDIQAFAKTLLAAAMRSMFDSSKSNSTHLSCAQNVSVAITAADIYSQLQSFEPLSSIGGSGTKQDTILSVAWGKIGGLRKAKKELKDVFSRPILYRQLYRNCPVRMPRGVLLYGPPGCGKTILGAAVADACSLASIYIRGPQLLDKYVGSSERAMRALFERAKGSGRPCLIFFDEFEALAPKRGRDNTGVTDRVVNQLLTFLDGVEDTMGNTAGDGQGQVFVLAATSRPDMVDIALLRPGRIEKHLYVGFPSEKQRLEIMLLALASYKYSEDVPAAVREISSDEFSRGYTGADIKGIIDTAYLMAVHECIEYRKSSSSSSSSRPLNALCDESSASTTRRDLDHGAIMTAAHLYRSLTSSKPSVSESDRKFYAEIHGRFRHASDYEDKSEAFPSADAGGNVLKQRTALH